MKPYGETSYEYLLCYVDGIISDSINPVGIIMEIKAILKFNNEKYE